MNYGGTLLGMWIQEKDYNAIVAGIYVLCAWIFAVEVLLLINRFNTQPDITY